MKLSTCAALALTLGLSGIAAAADGPSRAANANAIAPLYWHCIYQSENGGVYEFVQRGRCALIVNHQTLGQLSLIDAYQA
ncbi:hypothetical protein GLE_0224 [Lysobacter enzymogenes]|uniref:Uncharacterized protein n=1 Tax=Lysobacter enzymogenes TaxID=69 RepID=A0A0S2DAW2_LYSEN|nr:hypothetical protein [Lysobacter enzymogenes]ALN55583.1 hypothetical protein GLE_0224 [Lysobacter enzymogenes]QCW24624.1 hypothetical protein FE772_01960 [Lysobacter enzymogenes]